MRSLPDLDLGPAVDLPTGPAAPEDVLSRVKAEGARRRARRYRRNAVLAGVSLAALALPALSLLPSDGSSADVEVAADGGVAEGDDRSTASSVATPTTVDGPATTVVDVPPASVVVPDGGDDVEPTPTTEARSGPATTVPPTTVPAPSCQNSTDPACGDFRWEPAPPANQPLTLSFVDAPAEVPAGTPVTFTVTWSDADARLDWDHFSPDGVALASGCVAEPRHGPWTPPDPDGGSGTLTYSHTFDAPGTYTVLVSAGAGDCNGPYYSEDHAEVVVTVV